MATWNASGGSYASGSDCATTKTGKCVQELCLDNSGVLSVECLALGVQKLQYRVCSNHFENTMFTNYLRNRLCHNAIPTLKINIGNDENIQISMSFYKYLQ
ncbi:hypothetical protein ALC53_05844 [Atta colombica]|uniref:THAP-type domain-containing protein n=1 Tax=Atta colombica TaxID=520822 RepID=A0A151I3S5_9HYME|nr:hypothetical protein ALC53_05844 [Atta colombica]